MQSQGHSLILRLPLKISWKTLHNTKTQPDPRTPLPQNRIAKRSAHLPRKTLRKITDRKPKTQKGTLRHFAPQKITHHRYRKQKKPGFPFRARKITAQKSQQLSRKKKPEIKIRPRKF